MGVGGVATGEDAFQLILAGACAVQLATTHWLEGPSCFDRVASELSQIMAKKGYSSIADFRGKLKPYDRSNKPRDAEEPKSAAGPIGPPWMVALLVLLSIAVVFLLHLLYDATTLLSLFFGS